MREILGRRREAGSALLAAALTCAEQWHWPVVPGVGTEPHDGRRAGRGGGTGGDGGGGGARECACPRLDCPVPGAHPHDPGLLAATRDPRMVRWWWTNHPDAPLVLATGYQVSAVSLPASAGSDALRVLELLGARLGPVVASPTRWSLLVAPYALEELGELLHRHEWVPSSLRYHGRGGYVVLPPSSVPLGDGGTGEVRWAREPVVDRGRTAPWLPGIGDVVDTLVEAGRAAPDGPRLAF